MDLTNADHLQGDNNQAASNVIDTTNANASNTTGIACPQQAVEDELQYYYQLTEFQDQAAFQPIKFGFNDQLEQDVFEPAVRSDVEQIADNPMDSSVLLSIGTDPRSPPMSGLDHVMSSLTEPKPYSIETGDTFPLNPYHTRAKDSSIGMVISDSEPLVKDVPLTLPSVATHSRPTDYQEEKKSNDPEPVPKVFQVEDLVVKHSGLTLEQISKDPRLLERKFFEQLASYLNDMAYLEEDEEKKEWNDTLQLRDTQQVMKVDDDMLLVIFDAPTEQTVTVGWEPRLRDARNALVALLHFQLQLYKDLYDPSPVDRKLLHPLAVLMAQDRHLFKSPDDMDDGQFPLDWQPQHVVPRVMRMLKAEMLEEVLFGRQICSVRYRQARLKLIDEVSNLVRIVLAHTVSRPDPSVVLVEVDTKKEQISDGYFPNFVHRLQIRPQLKVDASHLLLRDSDQVLATATHVHHFVTNYAWLLTTKQLREAINRLDFQEPYGLMKNLTGRFMLTPKEVTDGLELNEPKALFLLKNASTMNQFNCQIQRANVLKQSLSESVKHKTSKTAFLTGYNIEPDALIARPNDTFMQVKKRTKPLVMTLQRKGSSEMDLPLVFDKRRSEPIPGEWYEHTTAAFFLQLLLHAQQVSKGFGEEYVTRHPPSFEWIVEQFAKYTENRIEQQVLYLDIDDSIKMQLLMPRVTELIDRLIQQQFKGNADKDATSTTNRCLHKLRSFLQKPVTPYQEVFILVLIHVFYPQVVYECFGVKGPEELGAYLDRLPCDETYLDKFDLSRVRKLQCSSHEQQRIAASTQASFANLKKNLDLLKSRDIITAQIEQQAIAKVNPKAARDANSMRKMSSILNSSRAQPIRESTTSEYKHLLSLVTVDNAVKFVNLGLSTLESMPDADAHHVRLLIQMMNVQDIALRRNALPLDKFIYFCLKYVKINLVTLRRRQDLELAVVQILGRLYDQVTSKLEQSPSLQSPTQIDTANTVQSDYEQGTIGDQDMK